jgi:hypothetical protein
MDEIEGIPVRLLKKIDSVFPLLSERQVRFFFDDKIFGD